MSKEDLKITLKEITGDTCWPIFNLDVEDHHDFPCNFRSGNWRGFDRPVADVIPVKTN